jgi:phosphoglycerate dehydrogenase-like enzyme
MIQERKTVLLLPYPHPASRLFTDADRAELEERFNVKELELGSGQIDAHLGDAFAIVGQPDLPRSRIEQARKLQAVLNIEGNFYPNVDYAALFDRGVHVLGCGPAYADAVAEYALGLALDLARGISREDRAFRRDSESYVASGNSDAILLRGAPIGLIGFGNLGRALRPLLEPFRPVLRVYDPWLPASALEREGLQPATLPEVLSTSAIVFVLATVTEQSEHLLGPAELDLLPPGARLVLVSRAAVVDYPALLERVAAGHLVAAIDVWPEEPVPADHPARGLEGLVLSAHRAGGIPQAFLQIGRMVVDDLTLIAAGLPPVRMQVAARELVDRYRNRPVS